MSVLVSLAPHSPPGATLLPCYHSDMLGSVSDYSLREGHSSVAIVRSTARQETVGHHLYMFATDGSRAAALAYCTLCHQ